MQKFKCFECTVVIVEGEMSPVGVIIDRGVRQGKVVILKESLLLGLPKSFFGKIYRVKISKEEDNYCIACELELVKEEDLAVVSQTINYCDITFIKSVRGCGVKILKAIIMSGPQHGKEVFISDKLLPIMKKSLYNMVGIAIMVEGKVIGVKF